MLGNVDKKIKELNDLIDVNNLDIEVEKEIRKEIIISLALLIIVLEGEEEIILHSNSIILNSLIIQPRS